MFDNHNTIVLFCCIYFFLFIVFPIVVFRLKVKESLQRMGALLPMNIFLRQEIDRIKKVIGIVQKTLCDLKLAIDGTIVMSQGLRESLDAMYDARIPQKWQKVIRIII